MENAATSGAITVWVPVTPVVELNKREHWSYAHKRHALQKQTTWAALRALELDEQHMIRSMGRMVVVMTAFTLQKPDPGDNLESSTKYYRDEVARFLDIDDGDDSKVVYVVKWKSAMSRGGRWKPGVEIAFIPLTPDLEAARAALEEQMKKLGAA